MFVFNKRGLATSLWLTLSWDRETQAHAECGGMEAGCEEGER